jgi:superfamily II DNA or RNA helicase
MSMRLEYRWIDYIAIFNDAKYEYYYEFLDNLSREQILCIEGQIIDLHTSNRNKDFQTEYFICDDIHVFNQSIINVLDKNKIRYIVHNIHDFDKSNYDNKPEIFNPVIPNMIKLNRYGQQSAFDKFKMIFDMQKYWGLMIAPTGWGKTLMHLIFLGYYLSQNKNTHVMLLTKKKDLLSDINDDIDSDINKLYDSGFFVTKPNIKYCVDDAFNPDEINKLVVQSFVIINVDKLINKRIIKSTIIHDPLAKIKKIDMNKFGFLIFDEVHHSGANCVYTIMDYLKNTVKLKYCIGSSATPVRHNTDNQNNIRKLFNKSCASEIKEDEELDRDDINILNEISYKEAWDEKIILPIKIELILIEHVKTITNKDKRIQGYEYTDRTVIKNKIIEVLAQSYRSKIIFFAHNRLSCIEWYEYINNREEFTKYHKNISFSVNGYDKIIDSDSDYDSDSKNDNIQTLNDRVNKKKKELKLTNDIFEKGIKTFKSHEQNSFLFVVGRAIEGYDDRPLDIVFNLDPVLDPSIVLQMQKMGRTIRIMEGKNMGIYVCPIVRSDDYIDILTSFMADYIRAISKPIADKKHFELDTLTEFRNTYHKIFNISGFDEIDGKTLYDKTIQKIDPDITYRKAIKIIKSSEPKPNNITEYDELCNHDARLIKSPKEHYGDRFDWIDYLSIPRDYYDFDVCKERVEHILKNNPDFHKMKPSDTCSNLCNYDKMFPPNGMWTYYYKIHDIHELIPVKKRKKIIKKIISDDIQC